MKVWIVFTPHETYLDGALVTPKVFASERSATLYWEQMNLKLSADFKEQKWQPGKVYRPGKREFLRISEQEIEMKN